MIPDVTGKRRSRGKLYSVNPLFDRIASSDNIDINVGVSQIRNSAYNPTSEFRDRNSNN